LTVGELSPGARAHTRLGARRRRAGEDLVKVILGAAAFISVLTTVGIVVALLLPALEFFGEISPTTFFSGTDWAPLFEPARFGVLPLLAGTLVVTAVATVVCVPFGLGAAIYLSEYARPRVRAVVKPLLEVLVGIPTVVFGYFALTFVTPLLKDLGFQVEVFNALSAGLVMGVMLIPIVASLSEDAMIGISRRLVADLQEQWRVKRQRALLVPDRLVEAIGRKAHRVDDKAQGREGGRVVRKLLADIVEAPVQRAISAAQEAYRRCTQLVVEYADLAEGALQGDPRAKDVHVRFENTSADAA